jgi:hypothetical protein
MNYCTKCHSIYAKPGTCNCYAETQPAVVQPWQPAPIQTPTQMQRSYWEVYPWMVTFSATNGSPPILWYSA